MDYSTIIWYIAIVAAAVMVLIALTNIFAQVIKKIINRDNMPAQALVFAIAEVLTFLAMAIICAILHIHALWYFWVLAFIVGVLVTYGAIFGYDNLYSQLGTAITNLIKAMFKGGDQA